MLVLSRKRHSSIHIGPNITVSILEIRKNHVRVGVEAPRNTPVWRNELAHQFEDGPSRQPRQGERANGEKTLDVLLVEDDPGHAKLICHALSECKSVESIEVGIAETGELAMEALQVAAGDGTVNRPFDLVMLDLYLPRMSGLDVLRRIRTDPVLDLTPVVVFSSADEEAAARVCLEAGANAFVAKSPDAETFRNSVARIATFWGNECCVPRPLNSVPK